MLRQNSVVGGEKRIRANWGGSETYNSQHSSNHNSYCQANIKEPFCTHAHIHTEIYTHIHIHTCTHIYTVSIKSKGPTKKLYQYLCLSAEKNFLLLFWEQSEKEVNVIPDTKPKTPFQPISHSHDAPGHLTHPRRCSKEQNYQPLLVCKPPRHSPSTKLFANSVYFYRASQTYLRYVELKQIWNHKHALVSSSPKLSSNQSIKWKRSSSLTNH